jgi:hypothetical protein
MPLATNAPKRYPNLPPKAAIMGVVDIEHFSDILCVWAYISQIRIEAIKEKFGDVVRIKHRFCSVFGDAHLRQVAGKFPHIEIHPDIWLNTRPSTSMSPHSFGHGVCRARRRLSGSGETAHRRQPKSRAEPGPAEALWQYRVLGDRGQRARLNANPRERRRELVLSRLPAADCYELRKLPELRRRR